MDSIDAALARESSSATWGEVLNPEWRKPLLVGLGLAIFQQVTGINAIIYCADQIFGAAGFATVASRTTVTTWAIGGVNVLATLIAIAFIDHCGPPQAVTDRIDRHGGEPHRRGRRVSFHYPTAPSAAVAATGLSVAGLVTLVGLIAFTISFAFSLGPVVWTVINEIFPGRIRGRAAAICTAVNGAPPSWSVAGQRNRQLLDLLPVRAPKRYRLGLGLFLCAGGEGTNPGGADPVALEGKG